MRDIDVPYKFGQPWANAATVGFNTNPIPATSSGAAAGQDLGFPPITAEPIAAGGVPPDINDFNGAFFYATSWVQWVAAGGPILYDAVFSAAIGGYPKGAILTQAADATSAWVSTVDNNTSDPDTGGANWSSGSAGRLIGTQIFSATGTYNPVSTAVGFIEVEAVGGGGAGGGSQAVIAGEGSGGSGGQAGGYARAKFTTGFTGGIAVTIAAGGVGVSGASGGGGGTTTFGALLTVPGGAGGTTGGVINPPGPLVGTVPTGVLPSVGSGTLIVGFSGQNGDIGFVLDAVGGVQAGYGGSTPLGAGGPVASGFGYGGAGATSGVPPDSARAGANGGGGYVIVKEYSR